MTHDFKGALEAVEFCLNIIKHPTTEPKDNCIWSVGTHEKPTITEDKLESIRLALKIADRLMGEPSYGMKEAYGLIRTYENSFQPDGDDVFKAMRDQLLKECEE